MFSFAGWEAVAPLTTRFADPARQLPRAVAIALAATTVLYLGLAVATISVLGPRAATDIPLAGLLSHAIGAAGPDVAAVAAIVLTLGATNAYINGAAAWPGSWRPVARAAALAWCRLLAAIGVAGLLLIGLYGLGIVGTAALVAVPTVLFLTVYLGAMTAAVRVLRGRVRLAALPGRAGRGGDAGLLRLGPGAACGYCAGRLLAAGRSPAFRAVRGPGGRRGTRWSGRPGPAGSRSAGRGRRGRPG